MFSILSYVNQVQVGCSGLGGDPFHREKRFDGQAVEEHCKTDCSISLTHGVIESSERSVAPRKHYSSLPHYY